MSFFDDFGGFINGDGSGILLGTAGTVYLHDAIAGATDEQGSKLANAQIDAARNAQSLQRRQFTDLRKDSELPRELRNNSLSNVNRLLGLTNLDQNQFYLSPEYNNTYAGASRIADGQTGNIRNALLKRAGKIATGEFNNYTNRLLTQGGIGSSGLNSTNAQLQDNINQQSRLLNDAGEAAAAGVIGASNAKNQTAAGIGSLVGSIFSDRRLKTDIKRVGETDDGLVVYTFKYKDDPNGKTQMGVMAQEVEKEQPDAAYTDKSGYKKVNLDKIA